MKTPHITRILKKIQDYNCHVPDTDNDFTVKERDDVIRELGTWTSMDGILPEIYKIPPREIRTILHLLIKRTYDAHYPEVAYSQKGQSVTDPKLRGIGIGPGLSRIYDMMLN